MENIYRIIHFQQKRYDTGVESKSPRKRTCRIATHHESVMSIYILCMYVTGFEFKCGRGTAQQM
jgi:hypothetical protein